jgi:alpha-tubulin suppressor-like RCC1 family protein
MRHALAAVALAFALSSPGVLAQPAWGPVYHWGQDEGAINAPTGYFKQVSTGWGYTVGLRPNGSIEVWGDPALSYDGDWDDVLNTNLPASGTWISIQAGYVEAIALKSDGSVHVWGAHLPLPPDDPYACNGAELTLDDCEDCEFSVVAAGENFFVGIVDGGAHDGDLFIWGGVSCFDPRSLTDDGYVDAGAGHYFTNVSACGHHILAQKESGALVALASPIAEDGGDCTECCERKYRYSPGVYPPPSNEYDWWGNPPTSSVDLFSAGHGHSLVWTSESGLYGWGNNAFGQAGIVTTAEDGVDPLPDCDQVDRYNYTDASYPDGRTDVDNLAFPSDPVKIEGADAHSTALLEDGTLIAWGDNRAGYDFPSDTPAGAFLDFSSKQLHGAAISTCYADCDANGELTTFDYLCFYSLVQANDISADCNEDTYVNSYDVTCFQALLTAGCP